MDCSVLSLWHGLFGIGSPGKFHLILDEIQRPGGFLLRAWNDMNFKGLIPFLHDGNGWAAFFRILLVLHFQCLLCKEGLCFLFMDWLLMRRSKKHIGKKRMAVAQKLIQKHIGRKWKVVRCMEVEGCGIKKDEGDDMTKEAYEMAKKHKYRDVVRALKRGDLRLLRCALQEHEDHQAYDEFWQAGELRDREMDLKAQITSLIDKGKEKPKAESEASDLGPVVTKVDIQHIVSSWTGIPVDKVSSEEFNKLLKMKDTLHQRIIGQAEFDSILVGLEFSCCDLVRNLDFISFCHDN
ncbi:hypothetical protein IFM89_007572 [Coptis chinensis]|uniref:Uncharacterized protein n=1 Tax=Coptis chinensis TaxID=261450 RepID=A0A835M2D4_9MAGN|nr:hypothetical protein IFM89_007572 [Coptis chinensis]